MKDFLRFEAYPRCVMPGTFEIHHANAEIGWGDRFPDVVKCGDAILDAIVDAIVDCSTNS